MAKLAKTLGALAWTLLCVAAGALLSVLAFVALEMNDRLKYEAAYLNGYVAAQRALKEQGPQKASELMDFLIDAHVATLSEFMFLASEEDSIRLDKALCRAAALRKEHPAERGPKDGEAAKFYTEIDQYLSSKEVEC